MAPKRSWKEIWTRLSAMPDAELGCRVRQELEKRADLLRYRLGMRFHEDGTELPAGRQYGFFFEPGDVPALIDSLRQRLPHQAERIMEDAEHICAHRFRLLGYADLDYGSNIDWHFDAVHDKRSPRKSWFDIRYLDPEEVGDAKVIWELNRHQHLVTLAKAYRLIQEKRFAKEIFDQWYSWQSDNPYPIGINWSSSLEAAFRSISWLWVRALVEGCDVVPQQFSSDLLRAFSIHGRHIERYLSTYYSPNTHLLGEGVGLFFLGTLCPQLPGAGRWQKKGWQIVLDEARRQVRPDGFHFEQSTYYHVYALDFFLHARMLALRNHISIPSWFDATLEKMLAALCLLSQDGISPSFGDDDGGRVFDSSRNRREHLLDPLSTGAVMFKRGDFKVASGGLLEETLWLLGTGAPALFDETTANSYTKGSGALPGSGFYVMVKSDPFPQQLVINAGPRGAHSAGHRHADALSIHLAADGRELLCDPGSFEYGSAGLGRRWFRSTGAHNTLQVDGLDQAEAKGPFAWSSLPNVQVECWIAGQRFDVFVGNHDGYRRLSNSVTHQRWVLNFKSHFWLIRDVVTGSGEHSLDISWHLGPDFSRHSGIFLALGGRTGLGLLSAEGHGWSEDVHEEWWSPVYGQKIAATATHFRCTGPLPAEFVTLLVATAKIRSEFGSFVQTQDKSSAPAVRGYQYTMQGGQQGAFFAEWSHSWALAGWASDADLLCYCAGANGLEALLFCNGTYVEWGGQRLISSDRPVTWCELVSGPVTTIFSPQQEAIVIHKAFESFSLELDPMPVVRGKHSDGIEK